ncbi:winged helix-turn-helix domain-containing protein [Sulfuriferula multivorans]|uniref:winged helix-turn-helix domain-containing protein n=1 Tax=Sulfuriferula multivorans TaxID=1559896 RepID=UPI000F5BD0ED|nr:winged helix-turn-helix domain-containing protein [Sulfuriferula multivorans]
MVEIKTVAEQSPDPKIGKPKPRSGVSFPYYNLQLSIDAAKIVHEKGGGACTREQLASYLGYSAVKNGGFLSRVSAARMFGLIEQEGDTIRVTERGQKILSPVIESEREQALIDSFMSVELFNKFYEQFKGNTLPAETGIKNLFLTQYKVVHDRIAPTIKIMFDSAETAGYFKVPGNRSKMVSPPMSNGGSHAQTPPPAPAGEMPQTNPPGKVKPVGDDGGNYHPFIQGLLKTLPQPETEWSIAGRVKWLQAASNIFGLIYTTKDGEDVEFIEIAKKTF